MNTKMIGECSEGQVIAALLKARKVILFPHGDNQRYDIAVDEGGRFCRIQVKTAHLKNDVITFQTCSTYAHRGGKKRDYAGQIEYFAAYCVENDKVYMVPEKMAGRTSMSLRLGPPSKHNSRGHNAAHTFEFTPNYMFVRM